MRKVYITILFLFFAKQFFAHTINCDSFCVVKIIYDTVPGYLNVTIANNDTNFINYPIIQLINTNNDTVANKQKTFNFYGQLEHSTQTYRIPTTLDSFPANWNGKVRIEDGLYHESCIIYPCTQLSVSINTLKHDFDFKVYPNPAISEVHILGNDNFEIGLFDLSGRQLMHGSSYQNNLTLILSAISPGMYYIHVSTGLYISMYPLVVVH